MSFSGGESRGRTRALIEHAAAGALLAAGFAALALSIAVPMTLLQQAAFGVGAFALASILHHLDRSRRTTIAIAILSTAITSRYVWWRVTQTLHFDNPLAALLGGGLLLAEIYAWVILFFGYIQCAWPLRRPVRQIPGPPSQWPTVDVYIPSYNEPLDIVQDTVLAAMSMDYPADRFRVWLLDDGRRPEFAAFAKAAGCGYLTRPDNKHAKAGNLNHALSRTTGELVVVFDADHVATRAFLQMTIGWFAADPKLALIQTPHYFYSPDPVQRNVTAVRDIQGEGALFYGVVQEGNDFWNAAFFCGSCAAIRRSALAEVGGFAPETVTEDAHTALKLQRLGWNTAYLNVRLSAGLATERLALHIGQRARWARGMTQILRIDNPLLGPGLKPLQRLCYLNAFLHFQFPLPRVVFLTSPLCYLLLGQSIIHASPLMILAFAGPHLMFAHLGNGRVQGSYNRSIWNEVYETILAFHLVGPSILPLFNPKAGKFNVTDKGGLLEKSYFDWRSLQPHLFVAALLGLGVVVAAIKLGAGQADADTTALNIFWSVYNMMILLTTVVVGRENRQVRVNLRADAELPATLYFDDGHIARGVTRDVSMGGVAITSPHATSWAGRNVSYIELEAGGQPFLFPTSTLRVTDEGMSLRFGQLSLDSRRWLVRVVFGRADAWPDPEKAPRITVLKAFRDLASANLSLLRPPGRAGARRRAEPQAPQRKSRGRPNRRAAAMIGLFLAAAALHPQPAAAAKAAAPAAPAAAPAAVEPGGVRTISLSLKSLGVDQPMQLQGVRGEAGVPYNVRADEVVTKASLTLNFAYSPDLLADLSHLVVLVNDEVVGTVDLVREGSGGVNVTVPIDPALFATRNRLNFRLIAHYTKDCEDPLHSSLWANISNTRTTLNLTLQHLDTGYDLARLPAPFLDLASPLPLNLPVAFLESPSDSLLQAAGAITGYFGMSASYRGFTFPVSLYDLPAGDGVVLVRGQPGPLAAALPSIDGPMIALIPNPKNRFATLLVIAGRNDDEVLAAARALAASSSAFSGARAVVTPVALPARKPYDAPRWVRPGRAVRLGDVVRPELLEGAGLRPGVLTAAFRTPPDLFFWPAAGPTLQLGYRFPSGDWLDHKMSRLDVLLNGKYLDTFPLTGESLGEKTRNVLGGAATGRTGKVELPAYNLFGADQLQFYYDLRLTKKGRCEGEVPGNIRTGIDADSRIDMSSAHHFARLPDLAFFTSAGFPYTRLADQGETTVVLAPQPSAAELETYLELMGRFADATGAAGVRVSVTRAGEPASLAGKDVLVIGPASLMQTVPDLFRGAPIQADQNNAIRVRTAGALARLFHPFGSNVDAAAPGQVNELLVNGSDLLTLMSWRSPVDHGRVVTALLAGSPQRLPGLLDKMADPKANYAIQGDVSVLSGASFTSLRVDQGFWSGDLPWPLRLMWWLSRNPLTLALAAVAASLILATGAYAVLKGLERRRLREFGEDDASA
jgi:cellulose synthase (UDP-forming)